MKTIADPSPTPATICQCGEGWTCSPGDLGEPVPALIPSCLICTISKAFRSSKEFRETYSFDGAWMPAVKNQFGGRTGKDLAATHSAV